MQRAFMCRRTWLSYCADQHTAACSACVLQLASTASGTAAHSPHATQQEDKLRRQAAEPSWLAQASLAQPRRRCASPVCLVDLGANPRVGNRHHFLEAGMVPQKLSVPRTLLRLHLCPGA